MKKYRVWIALILVICAQPLYAKPFDDMFPDLQNMFSANALNDLRGLDYKQGKVSIGSGLATLDVPDGYYFLDAKDAETVLHDFWINPKTYNTLGMIFPVHITPRDNFGWGLEISFDDIGYVSDKDADDYDYADVLKTMQVETLARNAARIQNNYAAIELMGWAVEPFYNRQTRHLYWAKELRFDDMAQSTLNFNIRALSRRGVLVMNFISDISALNEVKKATPDILSMVTFNEGQKYSDFDPSSDKIAAVSIGDLVADKVVAETGFSGTMSSLLKQFWFVLCAPFAWLTYVSFKQKRVV